jgi:DNA helicase-2/ATP-dependent DNA helicase PcrA
MGDIQVSEMFEASPNQEDQINITTIHGSKGMSLDAVLFFSSYQKPKKESGAYWKSWFETEEITEKNRLAYVSLSRAKHLLVLAIPKKKNSKDSDFKDLLNYGFEEYK